MEAAKLADINIIKVSVEKIKQVRLQVFQGVLAKGWRRKMVMLCNISRANARINKLCTKDNTKQKTTQNTTHNTTQNTKHNNTTTQQHNNRFIITNSSTHLGKVVFPQHDANATINARVALERRHHADLNLLCLSLLLQIGNCLLLL